MRASVRLSVIIPVYNASAWIPRCLECLRRQTIEDYEVLFADDCSTDDSVALIQAAAQHDGRIRLVKMERNGGPGPARNAGIACARGSYLAFLDVDDRYGSPRYLDRLCSAAETSGLLVAGASFANEHAGGRIERDFPEDGLFAGYSLREEGPVAYDLFQFDYGFHRFVFSRSLFEGGKNRFPGLRYYEDPVFLVRILHEAGSFFAVPDEEYLYRCDFRPQRWSTEKTLDYLEGVRENLAFSREEGLARLHWLTAVRFDWSCGKIGVGAKSGLDLQAISAALARAEKEIDRGLLRQGGPVCEPYRFALRNELSSLPARNPMQVLSAKAKYGLVNGRVWHVLRPYIKGGFKK